MLSSKVRKMNKDSDNDALLSDSLAERALEALSKEILSGRLAPGQRIDLAAYAAKWHISVTPIRDAAKHLEATGLLTVLPRRGIFVAELTPKDLNDIFEVRIALECLAIRLATPLIPETEAHRALDLYERAKEAKPDDSRDSALANIDSLIHDLAREYCGNPRLQKIMRSTEYLVKASQISTIAHVRQSYLASLPEHIEICKAVCDRDSDRAVRAMNRHLENTRARLRTRPASAERLSNRDDDRGEGENRNQKTPRSAALARNGRRRRSG